MSSRYCRRLGVALAVDGRGSRCGWLVAIREQLTKWKIWQRQSRDACLVYSMDSIGGIGSIGSVVTQQRDSKNGWCMSRRANAIRTPRYGARTMTLQFRGGTLRPRQHHTHHIHHTTYCQETSYQRENDQRRDCCSHRIASHRILSYRFVRQRKRYPCFYLYNLKRRMQNERTTTNLLHCKR